MKPLLGFFGKIVPDLKFERKHTLLCGDRVVVLSKMTGTLANPGLDELPIMPGIPVENIVGKKFESMAIDIQTISNGLIKHTYHIEDWSTALQQILNLGGTPIDLGFDSDFTNTNVLSRVPRNIESFYDTIIQNPGN